MRAFVSAVVIAIIIALVAVWVLDWYQVPSSVAYTTTGVRL